MQARQLAQLMQKKSRHQNLPTVCKACFLAKSSRSFGGDFKWCGRKYLASERGSIHSAPLQAQNMAGKKKNKAELQAYFNLPQDESALAFVMVTRLTEQKVLIY